MVTLAIAHRLPGPFPVPKAGVRVVIDAGTLPGDAVIRVQRGLVLRRPGVQLGLAVEVGAAGPDFFSVAAVGHVVAAVLLLPDKVAGGLEPAPMADLVGHDVQSGQNMLIPRQGGSPLTSKIWSMRFKLTSRQGGQTSGTDCTDSMPYRVPSSVTAPSWLLMGWRGTRITRTTSAWFCRAR